MEIELTQEIVNVAAEDIRHEWNTKVAESGQSEQMFIATDRTGFVSNFMYNYEVAKQHVESQGLVMPVIVEG